VNIFSVGFDIPQVDLIALLRPTLSTGLYVQQVGRATRLAPDKTDAVILGNIRRHGPVDDPQINVNGFFGSFASTVATITCPQCREENRMRAHACVCCGHVFACEPDDIRVYEPSRIRRTRHEAVAD
jgi:DNA repair protein RadD